MTRTVKAALAGVVLVAAVSGGFAGVLAASASPLPGDSSQKAEVIPSGVTEAGLSYGPVPMPSGDDDTVPDSLTPDLVSVMGDNGVLGYAESSLVFGDAWQAANPKDAVAQEAAREAARTAGDSVQHVIPVYAEDGMTQIDTFTIEYPPAPQTSVPR
ncbi:hypothetical protein [Micropruina sp.]|uniref:hypothetical protein n=1 Tax=Micropruina sp. TaxID=2737536 RepID=UPI0026250E87|nr:hypothetical protein [Micropruina sp.]